MKDWGVTGWRAAGFHPPVQKLRTLTPQEMLDRALAPSRTTKWADRKLSTLRPKPQEWEHEPVPAGFKRRI
jgi:hypothetical protein